MEQSAEELRHNITLEEKAEIGEKIFCLENMKQDNNWFCKYISHSYVNSINWAMQMLWNTKSLKEFMINYSNMKTSPSSPYFQFVEKLKELIVLLVNEDISTFVNKDKMYDLYPLRNVLEKSDETKNRFKMEEMADAGEAFGELLDIIYKDLESTQEEILLK